MQLTHLTVLCPTFPHRAFGARTAAAARTFFRQVLLLPMLVAMVACGTGCNRQTPAQPPPAAAAPEVRVAEVASRTVEEFDEFSARLAAVDQVEVRARVAGSLDRVHFRDGQVVRKGELLFTIDPRPFKAEVDRLTATVAAARSQGELARLEWSRAQKLVPLSAISQQEADQWRAGAQNANSSLAAAQAALEAARLNLSFTRITAPIAGRMSRTTVTAGNLVGVNEPVLTTIVSTDRMYAYFDASEAAYLKFVQAAGNQRTAPVVQMGLFNEQGFPHTGKIDFVDNRLDPATGSVQLRGVFDNRDGRFTPGLSARVRAGAGRPYLATLVPDRAITIDQTRKIVLVVGPNKVVQAREVQPGALINGMRVVTGVKPGELIVVDGLQRAMPGAPVRPQLVKLDQQGVSLPAASAPAPPSPTPPSKG